MKRKRSHWQVRAQVATDAARMLAEGGAADFAAARRKAGAANGVTDPGSLPDLAEVERAYSEYRSLFDVRSDDEEWRGQLRTAVDAMRHFKRFRPMLVGRILRGPLPDHSPIRLHLFADSSEEVLFELIEANIPYRAKDRPVAFADAAEQLMPSYRFLAGETEIELIVMRDLDRRRVPVSRSDGDELERAATGRVESLLADLGD